MPDFHVATILPVEMTTLVRSHVGHVVTQLVHLIYLMTLAEPYVDHVTALPYLLKTLLGPHVGHVGALPHFLKTPLEPHVGHVGALPHFLKTLLGPHVGRQV